MKQDSGEVIDVNGSGTTASGQFLANQAWFGTPTARGTTASESIEEPKYIERSRVENVGSVYQAIYLSNGDHLDCRDHNAIAHDAVSTQTPKRFLLM